MKLNKNNIKMKLIIKIIYKIKTITKIEYS